MIKYLKCEHGHLLITPCAKCEELKETRGITYKGIIMNFSKNHKPIRRDCNAEQCYCSGRCQEIIGYEEN